ncbi:MAG: hypothetical protein ACOX61_00675 [Brooklawnia sp.]|jgi:hypothetical protein
MTKIAETLAWQHRELIEAVTYIIAAPKRRRRRSLRRFASLFAAHLAAESLTVSASPGLAPAVGVLQELEPDTLAFEIEAALLREALQEHQNEVVNRLPVPTQRAVTALETVQEVAADLDQSDPRPMEDALVEAHRLIAERLSRVP